MTGKIIGVMWHDDFMISGIRWACRFSSAGHSVHLLNEGETWEPCDTIFFVDQFLPLDKMARSGGALKFMSRPMFELQTILHNIGFDAPQKDKRQRGIYYASSCCSIEGCASPFHMVTCFVCNGKVDKDGSCSSPEQVAACQEQVADGNCYASVAAVY